MAFVHIVLQGKGGVGKTLVATVLAQYIQDSHKNDGRLLAFDADPVNSAFSTYRRFRAQTLDMLPDGTVNLSDVNQMIDAALGHCGDVVIDIGPALFIPLANRLADGSIVRPLESQGWNVMVHSVVAGGSAQLETLEGLGRTIHSLPPGVPIVVWLNEFFGPIIAPDRHSFKEMKVYTSNLHRYAGLVQIPNKDPATFGTDLRQMLEKRRTFAEVIADADTRIMTRQRLTLMRNELYRQLDAILPTGLSME
ncbi:hypothetical protein [Azospirillum formosense]|uniref:nucleotide-binding protein n=1 Tax=Azospirillum formosense TaxID=861533 RepID=UPI00338E4F18